MRRRTRRSSRPARGRLVWLFESVAAAELDRYVAEVIASMTASGSRSDELFDRLMGGAVIAVLKNARFRKSGLNFHRRRGTCVQVVNFQVSRGSTWSQKQFYVNVGLAFDEICRLTNLPILEKPKKHECDDRGTRDRLGQLLPRSDEDWQIGSDEELAGTTERLCSAITGLVGELDRIDGPAAYRSHRWFDRFIPKPERAQILYILGDRAAARREVEELARLFADRQKANEPAWWIDQLGMKELTLPP